MLWKFRLGCFQGNVKKDVNYDSVACACIYACVYVLLVEILDRYDSGDRSEDSDDNVEDSDDCVVPTSKHRRICNLEALQLSLTVL